MPRVVTEDGLLVIIIVNVLLGLASGQRLNSFMKAVVNICSKHVYG